MLDFDFSVDVTEAALEQAILRSLKTTTFGIPGTVRATAIFPRSKIPLTPEAVVVAAEPDPAT